MFYDLRFAIEMWRRGVAVERRTRDQEVVGSSLSRALWCKTLGKFLTPRLVHDG